ncbi:hypothetical protein [Emticicia sp. W12TSBA100-4]|uniref:hypothetical protein n=1 Tax=Emticicia sp. W12TSBA100-4 TaxID=3160965 RepID=UPI003305AC04
MKIENPYENMVNFYHDNPSIMELYEYRNTDIYREIVLFLNDFNADWRKKKELGEYAADFILRIIKEFEEEKEDENLPFVQWLTNIYEEIADRYASTKSNYQFARAMSQDIKSLMEECTTDDDFLEDEFEKAYEKYKKEDDETVYLFF